jgi:hypothetical protein
MRKKSMLVVGIVVLAVALLLVVLVFSPALGTVQELGLGNPKNMTPEGVAQMGIQLDRSDRLSNQGMNIEQMLKAVLNMCSSKALNSDLEGITACNDFMEGYINTTGTFLEHYQNISNIILSGHDSLGSKY